MGALLTVSGVVKEFPGVRALDGVDLEVEAGEVHCLLGQNGAGKSTLIKVLAAAHRADSGEIRWKGEPASFPTPVAALRAGLATIYQELDLVDGLSVAENVFLGHEPSSLGFSKRGEMNEAARVLLKRLGHGEIRPAREVGSLSAAGKQVVSMARALSHEAQLIIMDEPSAVLDGGEVENLFRVIGDRVTVLKDGRTVAVGLPARSTPTSEVVRLMTGRNVEYAFPRSQGAAPDAPEILRVEGLGRRGEFSDVSFSVHSGEIVGLAGLVGSGRSEIVETVYGARKADSGRVVVDGQALRSGSVGAAIRAGLGLAPEERKSQGLLLFEPVYRNVSVSTLGRFSRAGFIMSGRELAA